MIIYAIYFITSDGRLMLSEIFQSSNQLPSQFILSGLLTSFKVIANELTNAYPETLVMGDVSYHFENFTDFFIVLVTDTKDKPSSMLFTLGLKFTSRYGHMINTWPGALDMFYDFKEIIFDELTKNFSYDISGSIEPNKRLDASELVFLAPHLKKVALELISQDEATLREIWLAINKDEPHSFASVRSALRELQNLGYAGQKEKNGETYYFV